MSETKAEWLEHYDWRSDKICEEPVQVDDKMKEYISKVSEVKIDWQNCFKCGNKNCVETYYRRNPATMEWKTAHGKCVECGRRFIV